MIEKIIQGGFIVFKVTYVAKIYENYILIGLNMYSILKDL